MKDATKLSLNSVGIGLALADEFLRLGDRVLICGRTQAHLDTALAILKQRHPEGEIHIVQADITKEEDCARLANQAKEVRLSLKASRDSRGETHLILRSSVVSTSGSTTLAWLERGATCP